MARYSEKTISDVSRQNNIADVASLYLQLRRNGTDFVGLCPFHKEKTPSFHISEDKQLFYCFGCGAGGNVYDFIMKIENLDFVDSLQFLAQRAGVELVEERINNEQSTKEHELKQRLYEMNKIAARHFWDNLISHESTIVHEYVEKRGLDKNTILKFGIGFAKDSWNDLHDHLKENGFSDDEILKGGLIAKNENGKVYDKFRNRLMFPIMDVRGNVIAFGGRTLGDDAAKYMNSPETPVFYKGRNLFALNLAKQYGLKQGLILVEGYMDVVSLYQRGIHNVVAGLGTAFTDEQAKLLKRYASEVYVCYDSDEAGQKAAAKSIELLTDAQNKVKVLHFSGAKDPDEYILQKGAESFKLLIKNALAATEYKIMQIRKNYDITDVTDKITFVNEAAVILAKVENAVEREAYTKRIALETDISVDSINAEINKQIYSANKKEVRKEEYKANYQSTAANSSAELLEGQNTATYKSERTLLNVIFFSNKAYAIAQIDADVDLFSSELNKKLFLVMMDYKSKNEEAEAPVFISQLDDSLKNHATAILFTEYQFDASVAVKDVINKLKDEQMKKMMNKLAKEGKLTELNELIQKQRERRGTNW